MRKSDFNRRRFGLSQEQRARRFLQKQGLHTLCSNYSCKVGEIDLVMLHKPRQLVFVEVRYRRDARFGGSLESITRAKQRRIRLAAAHYLLGQPSMQYLNCRFDVVAISAQANGTDRIDWIQAAFE